MIELPNGKVARTQAEQVGFNSKKIEEIIKFLNESGLKDLVINLEAASGVLTDEQYAIAELSPSYIVLSGKVYYKGYEDGTNIDFFEAVPEAAAATSLFLQVARIRIVEATKNYALSSVNIFESYNKSQIDSIISTLNDAKASLSGANFSGPITAPSIIENMSGYSYGAADTIVTPIYSGVVKNGNKVTFAIFAKFTPTSDISGTTFVTLGNFYIPEAVGNKLTPFSYGGYGNILEVKAQAAFTGLGSNVPCSVYVQKASSTNLAVRIRAMSGATLLNGAEYLVRVEITFLLSDNLAS